MPNLNHSMNFHHILNHKSDACAVIRGSDEYPKIHGTVRFYDTNMGVLTRAEIFNLPENSHICKSPIFAFHIHSGGSCTGTVPDPFANALTHLNPMNCPHPYHAGDLPPLFGAGGYAYSVILTDRFSIRDIIGRTAVIHSSYDDFTTQPAGNSGKKIACGVIMKG